MSDYISRQAAIDELKFCELGEEMSIIETMPSADVVEVVRCKDCIYWCNHARLNIPWCRELHIDRGSEDYCSLGERRTDGEIH